MTKTTKTTKPAAAKMAAAFDMPTDMRAFTEQSVDQAKVIYGQFKDAAQDAVDKLDESSVAFKDASAELQLTAIDLAQKNTVAGFDFARKLVGAKDFKEVVELQADFAREQAATLAEQGKELGTMSTKVGELAFQPFKNGMPSFFDQFKPV